MRTDDLERRNGSLDEVIHERREKNVSLLQSMGVFRSNTQDGTDSLPLRSSSEVSFSAGMGKIASGVIKQLYALAKWFVPDDKKIDGIEYLNEHTTNFKMKMPSNSEAKLIARAIHQFAEYNPGVPMNVSNVTNPLEVLQEYEKLSNDRSLPLTLTFSGTTQVDEDVTKVLKELSHSNPNEAGPEDYNDRLNL